MPIAYSFFKKNYQFWHTILYLFHVWSIVTQHLYTSWYDHKSSNHLLPCKVILK